MNIIDVKNMYPEVNITIKVGELLEMVEYTIKRTRQELEQQITDANTETYPSPEQVAKILDVDKSTLWRWDKKDFLKPVKIGGKNRYKMSDVKRILKNN